MLTCWFCGLKKPAACCCFMRSCWCCGVACGCMLVVWAVCGAACWAGWTDAAAEGGTLVPTPGGEKNQKNRWRQLLAQMRRKTTIVYHIKSIIFKCDHISADLTKSPNICMDSCSHPAFTYTNSWQRKVWKVWVFCAVVCFLEKNHPQIRHMEIVFQLLVIFGKADTLGLISTFISFYFPNIIYILFLKNDLDEHPVRTAHKNVRVCCN